MGKNEVVRATDVMPGFGSLQSFELAQRAAKLLAQSDLVPKEYQGNIPNCVIALNMAQRMDADPLMVMQNLYIVHGSPGWSAQFLISTFNTSGRFTALRYDWIGEEGTDEWGCKAWATEKETGERLEGSPVTIGLAKAEGWHQRNGSKWKTMPGQMLMYRAASWFIRTYAPEIAMGMHTDLEIIDCDDYEVIESQVKTEVEEEANKEELDIAHDSEDDANEASPEPEEQPEEQPDKQVQDGQQTLADGPGF